MLDADERALIDRLSVFAGPFTLEDAEALGDQPGVQLVSRAIGGLVDKSMALLRTDDQRYELLPPVQAVGRSHLDAQGDHERWRARHAELVGTKARRIDAGLQTGDEAMFSTLFDDDVAELRTARAWLVQFGDVDALIGLCASFHWFAMLRTRSELSRWAEDAVARSATVGEPPGIGRARACAANGAAMRGDLVGARALADPASVEAEDEQRFCLEILGQVNVYEGNLADAAACRESSLGAARRCRRSALRHQCGERRGRRPRL